MDSSVQGRSRVFQPFERFRDRFVIVRKDGREESIEAPELIYLPGGTFRMGYARGYEYETPVHPVSVSAFALGRTPVTWGEYQRFCEATGSHWPQWLQPGSQYHLETGAERYYAKCGIGRAALDLPVVGIAWYNARAYCAWLSAQTGERYALPTEAQWEYACRAGTRTRWRWSFGDDEDRLGDYAWFRGNAGGRLHAVAQKRANDWGLHDMHGNCREWCADWYAWDYYRQLTRALAAAASGLQPIASARELSASGAAADASVSPAATAAHSQPTGVHSQSTAAVASSVQQAASENPCGPESGSHRVVRGGAWDHEAGSCRSAYRNSRDPSDRNDVLGFRLSRTV